MLEQREKSAELGNFYSVGFGSVCNNAVSFCKKCLVLVLLKHPRMRDIFQFKLAT